MDVVAGIASDTDVATNVATNICDATLIDTTESPDFGFLPKSLTTQCRSLIESYHEIGRAHV